VFVPVPENQNTEETREGEGMTRQKKELSVEALRIGGWMLVALVAIKAGEKLRPKVPGLRPKT